MDLHLDLLLYMDFAYDLYHLELLLLLHLELYLELEDMPSLLEGIGHETYLWVVLIVMATPVMVVLVILNANSSLGTNVVLVKIQRQYLALFPMLWFVPHM